jgi:hypothetical protein
MATPLMTRWTAGPAVDSGGPVVVSVTDFTSHRLRDYPSVMATGLRLRLGWFALGGAVGLKLWSLPLARRSGSISVWESAEALRGFVALPEHVEIMRRNRHRGRLRSTTWSSDRYEHREVLRRAREWIAG